MKIKLIIIIISALLMALANPPFSLWYLAWFSLAPLWVILILSKNQPEKSKFKVNLTQNILSLIPHKILQIILNQKFLFPLIWGCIFYGFSLFWITGIHPLTWMGIPWLSSLLITIFCFIFVTLWATTLVIAWGWLLTKISKIKIFNKIQTNQQLKSIIESLKRIIIGVTIWSLLEIIESHTPLWWISLGLTQSPSNLIILQLGKLSGLTTITASIVAVNGLIAEGIIHLYLNQKKVFNPQHKSYYAFLSFAFILLTILHSIGFYIYQKPIAKNDQNAIKIGLIQGNIPPQLKSFPQGFYQALEGYTKGYQKLSNQGADLIITPETALPFFFKDFVFHSSLYQAILKQKTPIILGGFSQQDHGYTNSLFSLTKTGEILSQYDKIKLVPLGEYIPFQSILGKLITRLSAFNIVLIKGSQKQISDPFKTAVGKSIIGICYESAFPNIFRLQTLTGGEFMITASNNSFYRNSMLFQHHAQDVLRAIENDRWLARSTNTGLSAIINPQGKTIWISQINTYESHLNYIYKRQTRTPYVKYGDWLIWILLLLAIIILPISA